jgi:hypothetical protein
MKATDFESQGYFPTEAADALVELRPSEDCYFHKLRDLVWNSDQPKPTHAQMVQKMNELRVHRKHLEYRFNRKEAYIAEADPLFFKAQRGEATLQEWQDKVEEIKARYPYE